MTTIEGAKYASFIQEVTNVVSFNHLSSLYTAAPVIDTPSSSYVTVIIGSFLKLNCTSRGSPPDTFTWRKDNHPTVLQSTSITPVYYNSTSAVFHTNYSIDSVTISDSGTYTCTVTNPIGSYSATITVDVGKLSLTTQWCNASVNVRSIM